MDQTITNDVKLFFFPSMAHRYHGQIGANLILGGVDCTGNHLYKVGPYGSVDKVPYLTMGMHAVALHEEFFYKYDVFMKLCVKWVNVFNHSLLCVHEGSGDLAALGILEDGFKHDMEVPE